MSQIYPAEASREPDRSQAEVDGRPIGVLVNDIWEKAETLVRQEMKLGLTEAQEKVDALKAELDERLKRLKLEAAGKALGGAMAIGGSLTLAAAIVLLLSLVMWPWLAALLTGIVLSTVGVMLLKRPVKLPALPDPNEFAPKRTAQNIKSDIHAIEEASHGAK